MEVTFKRGDTWPPLEATLRWGDGAAIDLTGATVVFSLRKATTGELVVNRAPVTVVAPSAGVVQYQWRPGDLAESDTYYGEFEVLLPSGNVVTVPNDTYLIVRVVPDLG